MIKFKKNKSGLKLLALLVLVSIGIRIASPKNANRIYKYIICDRIIDPIWLVLTANDHDTTTTKLPIYEIDIDPRLAQELNADLFQNKYEFGPMPHENLDPSIKSYNQYKSAIFRHGGLRFPVEVRYRGDNPNHREGHQKSWRIKFKKHDRFNDGRLLNLINPKSPTALTGMFTCRLAYDLELIAPQVQFVHEIVNRKYQGVSLCTEQIDKFFLINHRLAEGNIYYGESKVVYPGYDGLRMLEDPLAWQRQEIMVDTDLSPHEDPIGRFVKALAIKDNEQFMREFEQIFDMDYWYNIYALSAICGYFHRDTFHNHKYYYNPVSGKLMTIVWDIQGVGYPHELEDMDFFPPTNVTNICTGRIFQVPEYVERKNKRLWEILNGPCSLENQLRHYDELYNLIKTDMYADKYKDAGNPIGLYTNSEWESEVAYQRQWIIDRYNYLKEQLDFNDCSIAFEPKGQSHLADKHIAGQLVLTNAGECGIRIDKLQFEAEKISNGNFELFCDINNNGILDNEDMSLASCQHNLTFTCQRAFLPARVKVDPKHWSSWKMRLRYDLKRESSCYRLFVVSDNDLDYELKLGKLIAVNNITGSEIKVQQLETIDARNIGIKPFTFADGYEIVDTVTWRDEVKLNEDLILPRTTKLIIHPGTNIKLAEGVSVLCYGPVEAIGTQNAPIIFEPASTKPWGVFSMQGKYADGSKLLNCNFSGGKDERINHVFYSGMVNAYNCNILMEDCIIEGASGDDGVNFKAADNGIVRNCQFIKNSFDALDLDFSNALVENCQFIDSGNDSLDLGTASAVIRNNHIIGSGDKGISSGENSHPQIYDNVIEKCNVGIASKDSSKPVIRNCKIKNNRTAIACYQKKIKYGPSSIEITNSEITGNGVALTADMNSTLTIKNSVLQTDGFIHKLPDGIVENPVAPTLMKRSLNWPGMVFKNNKSEKN
ncbi:MAG: CotH kinase family protein [Phycisphaerae bacterium]|nr:CotH kinase family protein [Phycisphaerae bacterium]